MSQTLPMTRGQRDDFEAHIEEQSSIIKITRMQGRELKAEEKQFFQDFVDYAHQWFNSLGATHDAPLQEPACPPLAAPSLELNCNSWIKVEGTSAEDEELAILEPNVQWIDENLDFIIQASKACMPCEESDIFEEGIVKLVTNLKQKCMNGLRMQEGEARALEDFVTSAQALLKCTSPWLEHHTPIIEPQVPWPTPDDPSLYINCKNELWEQEKEERGEENFDDSTAYLLENPSPWPAINDLVFTKPWPPADEPSLSPMLLWSKDNEEEFNREPLHYALEEEAISAFPHGDEQATPQHLWDYSSNVRVDEGSPTCLITEEEQPINALAPPTQEEQAPCTSYHLDFIIESAPQSQYPSQQEEREMVELNVEFINMIFPPYFEEWKELT